MDFLIPILIFVVMAGVVLAVRYFRKKKATSTSTGGNPIDKNGPGTIKPK